MHFFNKIMSNRPFNFSHFFSATCKHFGITSCHLATVSLSLSSYFSLTIVANNLYKKRERHERILHMHLLLRKFFKFNHGAPKKCIKKICFFDLQKIFHDGYITGFRIRICIGSGFNQVSGSGSGLGPLFGIRIRIQEGKNDSQKKKKNYEISQFEVLDVLF